jgi:hypothetical protein
METTTIRPAFEPMALATKIDSNTVKPKFSTVWGRPLGIVVGVVAF